MQNRVTSPYGLIILCRQHERNDQLQHPDHTIRQQFLEWGVEIFFFVFPFNDKPPAQKNICVKREHEFDWGIQPFAQKQEKKIERQKRNYSEH